MVFGFLDRVRKILPVVEEAQLVVQNDELHDLEKGSSSTPQRAFPMMGIRLDGIREFIESVGGSTALANLTTTDVCSKFVVPLTADHCMSYCDFCCKAGKSFVGPATVFISHAWKYQFLTVVETLELFFKDADADKTYLWFDLFSNNQNGLNEPPPFSWWCDVFMGAIQKIGYVVMVMEPWNNPIPLTRAWCLWEIYCSENTESRFEVAMSTVSSEEFLTRIVEDSDSFTDMLGNVDVRKSESFNPLDREQIFEVINKSVGFQKLNMLVNDRMRQWVMSTVEGHIKKLETTLTPEMVDDALIQSLRFQLAFIDLKMKQKDYSSILLPKIIRYADSTIPSIATEYRFLTVKMEILQLSLDRCRTENSLLSAIKQDDLSSLSKKWDELKKETFLEHRQLTEKCQRLKADYPDQKTRCVALLLQILREKSRLITLLAIGCGRKDITDVLATLQTHLTKYGGNHKITLDCYSLYGRALRATGNYDPALENLSIAIEGRKQLLGLHHPDTLETQRMLGELYFWYRNYEKAEEILKDCLDHSIEKFGADGAISRDIESLLAQVKAANRTLVEELERHDLLVKIKSQISEIYDVIKELANTPFKAENVYQKALMVFVVVIFETVFIGFGLVTCTMYVCSALGVVSLYVFEAVHSELIRSKMMKGDSEYSRYIMNSMELKNRIVYMLWGLMLFGVICAAIVISPSSGSDVHEDTTFPSSQPSSAPSI